MNAPDYFENMDFSIPEVAASPCSGDENGVVASAGTTSITRAEVMVAVQNAVAGAVEAAVQGVVSEAVSAAVRANVSVNATEAERRFRQKYLGITPAGQEDVVLLRAPRLKVDESSVVMLDSAEESLTEVSAEESLTDVAAEESLTQIDVAKTAAQDDIAANMPPLDEAEEAMTAQHDTAEAIVQAGAESVAPVAGNESQPVAEEAVAVAVISPASASPEQVSPEQVSPEQVSPEQVSPEPAPTAPAVLAVPAKRDIPAMPGQDAKAAPSVEFALRDEKSVQFVGFQVGTQMYAVSSILIQEVIRRQPVNRLPVQTQFVPGVINLRGQVIPLVSLRELLQADMPREGSRNQFCIIIGTSGMHIALEVDRIRSMYVVQQSEIVWNVSGLLGLDDDTIIGLFELEERLVPILSVERVGAILLEEGLDFTALNT